MTTFLLVIIPLLAAIAIVCGVLSALSILPLWVCLLCLGIFEIVGFVWCVWDIVSRILLYSCWLREAQVAQNMEDIKKRKAWIREEVKMLCWAPLIMSMMILLYLIGNFGGRALVRLMEWFDSLKKPVLTS